MPGKKDEAKWSRAKQAVEQSRGKKEANFQDRDWGLVQHIYQSMNKSLDLISHHLKESEKHGNAEMYHYNCAQDKELPKELRKRHEELAKKHGDAQWEHERKAKHAHREKFGPEPMDEDDPRHFDRLKKDCRESVGNKMADSPEPKPYKKFGKSFTINMKVIKALKE